jgi:hypothetical protein
MNRVSRCLALAGRRGAAGLPGWSPALLGLRAGWARWSRLDWPCRGRAGAPRASVWLADWVLRSRCGQAYAHAAAFLCSWKKFRWHARGVCRAFTRHEPSGR